MAVRSLSKLLLILQKHIWTAVSRLLFRWDFVAQVARVNDVWHRRSSSLVRSEYQLDPVSCGFLDLYNKSEYVCMYVNILCCRLSERLKSYMASDGRMLDYQGFLNRQSSQSQTHTFLDSDTRSLLFIRTQAAMILTRSNGMGYLSDNEATELPGASPGPHTDPPEDRSLPLGSDPAAGRLRYGAAIF